MQLRITHLLFLLILVAGTFALFRPAILLMDGNVRLIKCFKALQLEHISFHTECSNAEVYGVTSNHALSLLHLQTLNDWRQTNYKNLSEICSEGNCVCINSQSNEFRAGMSSSLTAYYAVLAYRFEEGVFPDIISCRSQLVTSNYIWYQSISIRNTDPIQAEILWELAYLIDSGWKDEWQRGQTAYKQASQYKQLGEIQKAQQAYERVIETLQESSNDRDLSHTSLSLNALGEIALAQGDENLAEQLFRASILHYPSSGTASYNNLLQHWKANHVSIEDVYVEYDRMRKNVGENIVELTSAPALAFIEAGELNMARQFINSAPERIQQTSLLMYTMGRWYEANQEIEKAIVAYQSAIHVAPQEDLLFSATLLSSLSDMYALSNQTDLAIKYLEDALKNNPNARWYWYKLGLLYEENRNWVQSEEALKQALAIDPDNQTFRETIERIKTRDE